MKGIPEFRLAGITARELIPNRWDLIAFPLVFGILALTGIGAHQSLAPIATLTQSAISLDPIHLPEYALRTTLRMLSALVASLVFTFIYGTVAAKSRRAEIILIPLLDILQSIPVLGYIPFTYVFFMSLFPGRVAGAEAAVVFAIFTAQAWNMTFSFYQSLRTVPRDLEEATRGFHFSGWLRFWRLEVPFAMPGLIWNMMMSMSGSWFFIVAVEALTVDNKTIVLPGIGAYLAKAIDERSLSAVFWVIVAMTLVIVAYDQLMFRPLVAWADKFRFEQTSSEEKPESWFLQMLHRARLIQAVGQPVEHVFGSISRLNFFMPKPQAQDPDSPPPAASRVLDVAWYALVLLLTAYAVWRVVAFVGTEVSWPDVGTTFLLGIYTLLRVVILIAVAAAVWVPLGVMVGLRPSLAEKIQPLAQFLAAFPANLLFPVFVVGIVRFHANPDIWLSPLIILGTQWYILFNVIAGTTAYPSDFREAAANFHIRGWQWWRQVILPGIFPYFVTGAITASGGAWNASIVAEVVQWGNVKLVAHGLGAFITQNAAAGDYPRLVLGIGVMSLIVTLFNRILWRPLYRYAENRLRLD
ncbi:MAG TPA: ABC transporter permease subunit [Rhizomicrobium sp.]|nr:ABC transporter permease subunit [Rhizomicrobium sp.]